MPRPSTKPYVRFAEVYDRIMADVPYSRWADYITSLWRVHELTPSTVLDLACGTGSMTLLFASNGYRVTGLDASPNMLDIARAKIRSHGLYANFIQKDMRRFKLEEPVDAAFSVFDSMNYLLEPQDLQAAYKSVSAALVPGGLFIFDVNTQNRLSSIPSEVSIMEGRDHFLIWSDHYDAAKKWWRVQLTGFIKEDDDTWTRFDEVHRERAYPLEDHVLWLNDAGFEVLAAYESCTYNKASEKSSRVYFVAQKAVTQ